MRPDRLPLALLLPRLLQSLLLLQQQGLTVARHAAQRARGLPLPLQLQVLQLRLRCRQVFLGHGQVVPSLAQQLLTLAPDRRQVCGCR